MNGPLVYLEKLILLAKREGLQSLTVDSISFTFKAEAVVPKLEELAGIAKDLSEAEAEPSAEDLLLWSSE